MKSGIELIAEERQRQIEVEGWTAEHDAEHTDGELAQAAMVYASPATSFHGLCKTFPDYKEDVMVFVQRDFFWPWRSANGNEWLKLTPNDRVRELVKAGALIAAEIDRLQAIPNQQTSTT